MPGGAALFADFRKRIDRYRDARDFPAVKGPSYLSVHLRFGTVSIRELVAFAHFRSLQPGGEGAATWLSELVWREFYAQILWHHPHVVARAFKPEYDALAFPNDPANFAAWREGRTGYPIVDAAMRQLNASGYMHNRLRMIAASFLVKDLLVDWRLGERYFAEQLLDYDLASNNGGWQWAASTGCDAQPYFRIFNPVTQSERFDPGGDVHPALRAGARGARRRRDPRAVARPARAFCGQKASCSAATIPRRSSITRPRAPKRSRCSRPRGVQRTADYSSSCLRDFLYSATSCCCRLGGACS